jgi:hypothetical protein
MCTCYIVQEKHERVMFPKMAPTSRGRTYTSLIIWNWPPFQLPMVGSADLKGDSITYRNLSGEG